MEEFEPAGGDQHPRGIRFFDEGSALEFGESGMRDGPHFPPGIPEQFDLSLLATGASVSVLFREENPGGFSLLRATFGPHYPLPRHTHNVACLYYVLEGQAILGKRVVTPGQGFFVPPNAPYGYNAGPEGVVVLEFRHSCTFDNQIIEDNVERWKSIMATAESNQATWKDRARSSDSRR